MKKRKKLPKIKGKDIVKIAKIIGQIILELIN